MCNLHAVTFFFMWYIGNVLVIGFWKIYSVDINILNEINYKYIESQNEK